LKRAQERITRRKPIAKTCWEVSMEVEGWGNDRRLAGEGANERVGEGEGRGLVRGRGDVQKRAK